MPSKRHINAACAASARELETIRELAQDSFNGPHACYQHHAPAACRHLDTLAKAGRPLPAWFMANLKYFAAMGWRASR